MPKIIATSTAILALFAGAIPAQAEAHSGAQHRCTVEYEDQPGWDWVKCGNGYRGVLVAKRDGGLSKRVVSACQFQSLWYDGRIVYRGRYGAMPGDEHAKRYGCGFDALSY